MQLAINYSYDASVIPHRCRNARAVIATPATPYVATVTEISEADAPVAFRISDKALTEPGAVLEIRWWGQKLWKRAHLNQTGPKVALTPESLVSQTKYSLGLKTTYAFREVGVLDSSAYRQVISTTEADVCARIDKYLAGFVLIDGVFYCATAEPRYVVQTFGLGGNHGGTALFSTHYYNSNIRKSSYFRADQLADAIVAATAIALRRGDTQSVPMRPNGTIEVVIADAVRCNPPVEAGDGDEFSRQLEDVVSGAGGDTNVAGFGVLGLLARTLRT